MYILHGEETMGSCFVTRQKPELLIGNWVPWLWTDQFRPLNFGSMGMHHPLPSLFMQFRVRFSQTGLSHLCSVGFSILHFMEGGDPKIPRSLGLADCCRVKNIKSVYDFPTCLSNSLGRPDTFGHLTIHFIQWNLTFMGTSAIMVGPLGLYIWWIKLLEDQHLQFSLAGSHEFAMNIWYTFIEDDFFLSLHDFGIFMSCPCQ